MFVFLQATRPPIRSMAVDDEKEKTRQKYMQWLDELSSHLPKNPDNFIGNKKGEERLFWKFSRFLYEAAKELGEAELSKMLTEWAHKKDAIGKEDPMKPYALGHMLAHASSSLMQKGDSNAWMGKDFNGVVGHFEGAEPWEGVPKEADRLKTMLAWLGAYDAALKEQLTTTGVPDEKAKWYIDSARAVDALNVAAEVWSNQDQSDKNRRLLAQQAFLLLETYKAKLPKDVVLSGMGAGRFTSASTAFAPGGVITIAKLPSATQKRKTGWENTMIEKSKKVEWEADFNSTDFIDQGSNPDEQKKNIEIVMTYIAYAREGIAQESPYSAAQAFSLLKRPFLMLPMHWDPNLLAQYGNNMDAVWDEFEKRWHAGKMMGPGSVYDMLNKIPGETYFDEMVSSTKITTRAHTDISLQQYKPIFAFNVGLAQFGFDILKAKDPESTADALDFVRNYRRPERLFVGVGLTFRGTLYDVLEVARIVDEESVDNVALPPSVSKDMRKSYKQAAGVIDLPITITALNLMPVRNLFFNSYVNATAPIASMSLNFGRDSPSNVLTGPFKEFWRNTRGEIGTSLEYDYGSRWKSTLGYSGQYTGGFAPYHITSIGLQHINGSFGLINIRYDQPIGDVNKSGQIAVLFRPDMEWGIMKNIYGSFQAGEKGLLHMALGSSLDLGPITLNLQATYYPNLGKIGRGEGPSVDLLGSIYPGKFSGPIKF